MDKTDLNILRILQASPDLSVGQLAEKVGLSKTPCWRRLKLLEDTGIIVGRAVILNPKKLELTVDVIAHLKLSKHDEETLKEFERQVQIHPEILECFSMAGESDYMIRVIMRSIDAYEAFMKKTVVHLPGVASVNSSFALKRIKLTTDLPL